MRILEIAASLQSQTNWFACFEEGSTLPSNPVLWKLQGLCILLERTYCCYTTVNPPIKLSSGSARLHRTLWSPWWPGLLIVLSQWEGQACTPLFHVLAIFLPFCCWSHGSGSRRLSPQCLHFQMWQSQTLNKKTDTALVSPKFIIKALNKTTWNRHAHWNPTMIKSYSMRLTYVSMRLLFSLDSTTSDCRERLTLWNSHHAKEFPTHRDSSLASFPLWLPGFLWALEQGLWQNRHKKCTKSWFTLQIVLNLVSLPGSDWPPTLFWRPTNDKKRVTAQNSWGGFTTVGFCRTPQLLPCIGIESVGRPWWN